MVWHGKRRNPPSSAPSHPVRVRAGTRGVRSESYVLLVEGEMERVWVNLISSFRVRCRPSEREHYWHGRPCLATRAVIPPY